MDLIGDLDSIKPWALAWGTRIAGVILLVAIAAVLSSYIRRGVHRALRRARVDETVAKFTANFVRWSVLVAAVVLVLGMFGVQATSFAAIIAAAGLAVGLAFQGTLSNFAAGVMLLVFRPFKVGDMVKVANQTGTVNEIDLFQTTLDTPDRRRIILPNSAVFGATIENMSYHAVRRLEVDIQIDPAADVDLSRRALIQAVSLVEGCLDNYEPAVLLTNIQTGFTEFQVQLWVTSSDQAVVRERLLRSVKIVRDLLKALPQASDAATLSIESRVAQALKENPALATGAKASPPLIPNAHRLD